MNLYNDFSDAESSSSKEERDKTTQLKHKSKNTFKYESFDDKMRKMKFRLIDNITHDYEYTKLQEDPTKIDKVEISIGEKFSNFKSLLDRENTMNNSSEYNLFYNLLYPYTISYVYLVNNYKKILDILYDTIQKEINMTLSNEDNKTGAQMKKMNISFIKSYLDLIVAIIKDLRGECYEYFTQKNLPQIINLLKLNEENTEMIEHIFIVFVNVFKLLEKSIRGDFGKLLIVYSEVLFHKNKYIRKFGAQSLCFIFKNLDKKEIVESMEFLIDIVKNPHKLLEIATDVKMSDDIQRDESKIIISALIDRDKFDIKMFFADALSELLFELLVNGKNLSIKSDLTLEKVCDLKRKDDIVNKIIFVQAFTKLIKHINIFKRENVISLFNYFIYVQFIQNNEKNNYRKIVKNDNIIKQLKLFDNHFKCKDIKEYYLIFTKELLTKNFKEANTIYFEYSNAVVSKILNEENDNCYLSDLELSLIVEVVALIIKFQPTQFTIDSIKLIFSKRKMVGKNINFFLRCLMNLNLFSFYQSFSLYSNSISNKIENADYDSIIYNKDIIYKAFDILINELPSYDYQIIINIMTTYERIFNKDDDVFEPMIITNQAKMDYIMSYTNKEFNEENIKVYLSDLTVLNYSKIDTLLTVIEMFMVENRKHFINVLQHIMNNCVLNLKANNNSIKEHLSNILLNEFYSDSIFYLDKNQAYLNCIWKCIKLAKDSLNISWVDKDIFNSIKSYGLYYYLKSILISNFDNNKDEEFDYLMMLSNNNKYKMSYLSFYKKYFFSKYHKQSEKYAEIINEIFLIIEKFFNITYNYQNEKKYSLSYEIIISKVEVLLSNEGISQCKLDLVLFILYFLLGCYWVTLTSIWPILDRALERLFSYIIRSSNISVYDAYSNKMFNKVINVINSLFSFIQSYPNESDYVAKENLSKRENYLIFMPNQDIYKGELSENNISTILSTKNAYEFRTISSFFNGISSGLSNSYPILLNSNSEYMNEYINKFIQMCRIFNSKIELYNIEKENFSKVMCIFYNYVLDKENKSNRILLKLKENIFTIISKLSSLMNINQKEILLNELFNQIIISRSVQIQKLSIDIISLFDTRIKSYIKLLNKIIDNNTIILELSNIETLQTDQGQQMKQEEREFLIPIITRLYYSKYFGLFTENSKKKTKNKINLVNYFIQLTHREFDEYINIILEPIANVNFNTLENFDMRTYKKLLEIIKINLKQITKLFNSKIGEITDKIKNIFLYLKSLNEQIKTNKHNIIDQIESEIISSSISKTKFKNYYDKNDITTYTNFFTRNIKEIKKETFKTFNMIFNQFYSETEMLDRISREICIAYHDNLSKKTGKINSIFRFFICLSKHARLHFIYRDNPIIIESIMKILSNPLTERSFILLIIDFFENIISVYNEYEHNQITEMDIEEEKNTNANIEEMYIEEEDDNENDLHIHLGDIPVDSENLNKNFNGIIVKHFDLINESFVSLMTSNKIRPTIKDKTTLRIIEILRKMWNLHYTQNDITKSILDFIITILDEDKNIFLDKETLNQVLKLCDIIIAIRLKVKNENESKTESKYLYKKFLHYIYKIENFNSRLFLCIILQSLTDKIDSRLYHIVELVTYLNTNKQTKREIGQELDNDKIIEKLSLIKEEFIIENLECIEPLIYQLIILGGIEDFAIASLSNDKVKIIARIISIYGKQEEFKSVIDVLFYFLRNKFSYGKNILDILNEMNCKTISEVSCGDLYGVIDENDIENGNLFNMLLNFKYDIRSEGLKILKNAFDKKVNISYYSVSNVIIPIIINFLNFKNYAEIPSKQKQKNFLIKRKNETLNDIVNQSIDLLPYIMKTITKDSEFTELLLFFYNNLKKISKFTDNSTFNTEYSIDILNMANRALTCVMQFLIMNKFSSQNFDVKYCDTIAKADKSSKNIREIFNSIYSSLEDSLDFSQYKDNDIYQIISTQIFPTLKDLLYNESKKENGKYYYIRNYIIFPFLLCTKIIKPNQYQSDILRLTIELVNNLSNLSPDIREKSREGIKSVIDILGEFFILVFFDNMQIKLHSGYQRHVLGFTVNYLLSFINTQETIEFSLDMIMPIIFDELFGDVAEEKEIDYLVGKYKEAKSNKGFNSFELISTKISLSSLVLDVITPLKNYLMNREHNEGVVHRCNEIMNFIVKGLKSNQSLLIDDVLEYSYALISVGIEKNLENAKQVRKMKNIEIKGNDIFTLNITNDYSIEIANSFIREKNDIIYSNIFASLGLDFILIALKRKMLNEYNESKLNDVIEKVVVCLKMSNNILLMSKSAKILISLFDKKLPVIKKNLNKITNTLFKNLTILNTKEIGPCQSILSGISEILSKFTFVQVSAEKIKTLIDFLKLHINQLEIKPYILSSFLSLIKKKTIHPSIYDMVNFLREVYLTSIDHNTLNVYQLIFFEFIKSYPLEAKGKMAHINFFITNMESKTRRCQLNSIKMLISFTEKKLEGVSEVLDFLIMKLYMIYANSEDTELKELIEELLESLYNNFTSDKFELYYHNAMKILKEKNINDKMSLFGLNVISLLLNHKFTFVNKDVQKVIQMSNKYIKVEIKEFEREIEDKLSENDYKNKNDNFNIQIKNWKVLYFLLIIIQKITTIYGTKISQQTLSLIIKALNHPHSFIKTVCLRLINNSSYLILSLTETELRFIANQIKFIIMSNSFEKRIYDYAKDIILLIHNEKTMEQGIISELFTGMTNDCKKWISNKAEGLDILNRVIDIFECTVKSDGLDKKTIKGIIDLTYRVINNNSAEEAIKNKCQGLMEELGKKIKKEELAKVYQEVTKEINFLKKKRKMEQVENFKMKNQKNQ